MGQMRSPCLKVDSGGAKEPMLKMEIEMLKNHSGLESKKIERIQKS